MPLIDCRQADFEAVAAELGYKNAGVAKDRWRQIRAKKFRPATESPLGGVAKSTPSKKSPDKAKKVVGEAGARGSSKKRKRQLKVEVMDDDEVGHGNIKAEEDAEDAGEADAEGDE